VLDTPERRGRRREKEYAAFHHLGQELSNAAKFPLIKLTISPSLTVYCHCKLEAVGAITTAGGGNRDEILIFSSETWTYD
jgi:hypothetical protein